MVERSALSHLVLAAPLLYASRALIDKLCKNSERGVGGLQLMIFAIPVDLGVSSTAVFMGSLSPS